MMTLAELIEHTDNVASLLAIKRHQLTRMRIDSTARHRHELAITALEGRVRELRRSADVLRGALPTLEINRVRPGVPPFIDMIKKSKPTGDLPATARKIGP